MRVLLIVIAVLSVAIPTAIAKPKVKIAVAPIKGDSGNKLANAVVDALAGKDFVVVGPKEVRREANLGADDELSRKDARKLVKKLEVAAVIDGEVTKAGKKRSLRLEINRRGKAPTGFTIEFKSTTSAGFRRAIHDQVVKKLDDDGEQQDDEDDEEAKRVAAKQAEDDERQRKEADDARRARDDDERRSKATDDAPRKRAAASDDEAADRGRRRGKRGADEAGKRGSRSEAEHVLPLARVAVGVSVAQRLLSFETRAGFTQIPPRVQTTAGAGRVDGEIYPVALASPGSKLDGLGLAASYDKTFGLSIKLPNQTVSAPISQSHYAIGARYRLGLGEASSVTFGLDYARRQYIADRSGLMALVLDAPDVDYTAVAPGVAGRVPVAAKVAVFAGVAGMLMLETGPIQQTTSYGPASVYGLEALGGVDIQVASLLALRIAVEYTQISFSFGNKGTMANNRDADPATQDVMGATDRSFGVAATLGLVY